jgi:hypothetical protein
VQRQGLVRAAGRGAFPEDQVNDPENIKQEMGLIWSLVSEITRTRSGRGRDLRYHRRRWPRGILLGIGKR